MAHAQKPDFVFRRNGRVHLNRWGASVQSTTGSRGVRINGGNVPRYCEGYCLLTPFARFPSTSSPRASRSAITFQLDSTNTPPAVTIPQHTHPQATTLFSLASNLSSNSHLCLGIPSGFLFTISYIVTTFLIAILVFRTYRYNRNKILILC